MTWKDTADAEMLSPLGLGSGNTIANRYGIIHEFPNKGNQADVYLCDDTDTGTTVVVKVYRQNIRPKENILQKLKENRHPNLIQYLEFQAWGKRYLEVMEYAEGGDLSEMMPIAEEAIIGEILPQIMEGINAVHEMDIVHRDIKPTNLFFKDKSRRVLGIADFGISSTLYGSRAEMSSGARTVEYASPEVFSRIIGREADYYSLGMTLLILAKGRSPFGPEMSDMAIMNAHIQGDIPMPEDISERFAQLLGGLLTTKYRNRWGYDEVKRWLNGENVPVPEHTPPEAPFIYTLASGQVARSTAELGELMLRFPEEAKSQIKKRIVYDTLRRIDQYLADRVDEIQSNANNMDECLVEIAYTLNQKMPYRLLDGVVAQTPGQLAVLIDRDTRTWEAGRTQLFNGMIPAWLRAAGYGEFAAEWKKTVGNFRR
ncbi:MAG: serine/threonine-protein kinase [Bacillota bacterium]|nr:serine/threonine-protein kinase [Bacillota bacterium]MDW7685011.1 serine/threonine-protein kinase [Bacillota bacterium]